MGKSCNHNVRKPRHRSADVLEPNQRLVIAVLAIGMIIGALVAPVASDAKPKNPKPTVAAASK